jgi:hypothetical protein
MPKTAWEARVGMLLDPARGKDFVWSYKPADSAMYGGQPRVDWLACDRNGRMWMIEVKSSPADRKSITLEREVSPGQIAALDAVATSSTGVALLAVGHEKTLYIFDWRKIGWLIKVAKVSGAVSQIPFTQADIRFSWTGPKTWHRDLWGAYQDLTMGSLPSSIPVSPVSGVLVGSLPGIPPIMPPSGIPPMMPPSGSPSLATPAPPSPSISKPSSMRQRRQRLLQNVPRSVDG